MDTSISSVSRRRFVQASAASALLASCGRAEADVVAEIKHTTKPRKFQKTLKISMVKVAGNLTAKFKAAKAAGFDGIELNAPGIDVDETKRAIEESGLPVDGTVGTNHWGTRHSDPDPKVRERALLELEQGLRETRAVGGHTLLLVVGKGDDGTPEQVWNRSVENIRKALPLCGELGMTIAIENVWNHFLYEHDGPNNQTADKFVEYVDAFNSPWVGMQFDIGNHWKYGDPAAWIRQLGSRIVKLDIKGFSRQSDSWKDITEDDLPWADVRQALDDIGFYGWVAAEVNGGNEERLRTIAQQIDQALNIA